MANLIGNKLGTCIQYQEETEWDSKFLRVQVKIDLNLPIRKGMTVQFKDGKVLWIYFKYKKLPNFCHNCGKLGHTLMDCEQSDLVKEATEGEEPAYREWLRASPLKKNRVIIEAKAIKININHGETSKIYGDHKQQQPWTNQEKEERMTWQDNLRLFRNRNICRRKESRLNLNQRLKIRWKQWFWL